MNERIRHRLSILPERLDAINDWRAATAVFFYSDGKWTTDGRAVFNLNPAQTIRRYQHELKTVD